MPAREFLDKFEHDPATFDYARFKAKMLAELDEDTSITTARVEELTGARDTDAATIRKLKSDAYDWMMKTGAKTEPVEPTATAGSGDQDESMPSIDSLFKRENTEQ